MDRNLKIVLSLGLVLVGFVAVLVAFSQNQQTYSQSANLEKFQSYEDLKKFLEENTVQNQGNVLFGGAEVARSTDVASPSAQTGGALTSESSKSASDYSGTNIQVKGVDEPDFVKNDGKYIYQVVQGRKVVITDAFPASEMRIVSEIDFDNSVQGLFLLDDKLIVLESIYGYYYGYGGPEVASDAVVRTTSVESKIIAPSEPVEPKLLVHVYDLADIENPKLEDTFTSKGNYYSARMIDGIVYVVSSYYANSQNPVIPFFSSDSDTKQIAASEIYYPIISDSSFSFTSVLSIDVEELDFSGNVFLTGSSGVSYVSKNAIYLTSQKYVDYQDFQEEMTKEVLLPLLPSEFRTDAREIIEGDGEIYSKSREIEQVYAKFFNGLSFEEKEDFQNKLQEEIKLFASSWSKKYQKTSIHKLSLDGLNVEYSISGEVPGYLLNQFSLDENDGKLRVATTSGDLWFGSGASSSGNNLYILDEDLEIIGKVEDLAEGERIYSARFVGDKAYMVTFRQVDPLYVIDLSDEENPKVLGYLKVTGFSSYLQPYDENHLIGIGREATLEGRQQGLKISLFDVSDFENPKEVSKYVFEGSWSYSEAEHDHKAVLFDKEKNLLVIPVNINNYDSNSYWQGVYAFDITEDNIALKGTIAHQNKLNGQREDYYDYNAYVRRSLYLDDVLYTVSDRKIKANSINDLNEIKELKLPFEEMDYPNILY